MIEIIYYNENVRCYREGRVERLFKRKGWTIVKNTDNSNGYNRITIDDKGIKRHRLIAFCWLGLENIDGTQSHNYDDEIDHINRNRLDNRVDNLRIVTHQQNGFNTNAKGYSWRKDSNKWESFITINQKKIHLGYYETEAEAHTAYLTAKLKYHPME